MDQSETRDLMEDVAAVMKLLVAKAVDPISERLSALEKRVSELPIGVNEDAVDTRVRRDLAGELGELRAALQRCEEGHADAVRALVAEAVAALPKPKDGVGLAGALIDRDGELVVTLSDGKQQKLGVVVGKSISRDDMQAMVREAVAELPAPDVKGLVAEHVAEAVAALPKPKSITVEDVRPVIEEAVAKAVAALPRPKDGRGLASMLIDRDGELVATMTDGRTEKLGRVVGRDGRDADMAALERRIAEAVAALPKPKDGQDGVGFDDLDLEITDAGAYFRFVKGERVKRIPVPMVIDRGVYKDGITYHKGASVTWGGCIWIAQRETSDKPGTSDAWRLSVKKGRDGKDAK
ncbi:MAG: hypothetical protein WC165_10770 [Dysgonamonadaceae bacterium]